MKRVFLSVAYFSVPRSGTRSTRRQQVIKLRAFRLELLSTSEQSIQSTSIQPGQAPNSEEA